MLQDSNIALEMRHSRTREATGQEAAAECALFVRVFEVSRRK